MLALLWKLNHKNVVLEQETRGESIGVLMKKGEYRYLPWKGFIEQSIAADLRHAKPVKLQVARVGKPGEISTSWQDLPPGSHVQGCLTAQGVYCVVVEDFIKLV